ncbi:hypothetical protein PROQFM164_S01g000986 [Penicillium roqueforti FM164]|uniref:LIM zinc-binding domain-containing protein n=2 Tax=Penicillium roqueforti TaxID=5082 RepID=W6QC00_PENRF|nr:hypothetical protein PROQFM164_S01g000986 [Penicillium roqueforti FM164]
MASMNMGMLPTIKCSNCGCNVEISSMGDHTCIRNEFVAPIPSPPSSAGFESDRFIEAKVGRGRPPAIDSSAANRAFLQPSMPTPVNNLHLPPLPASPVPPSTVRPYQHSLTDDSVFSFPMPGNRSPTEVRTPSPMTDRTAPKPRPPLSSQGQGLSLMPENIKLPPSPMPPMSPDKNHRREESAVSNSSYRTSLASSRYGGSTTRSSSNSLSRGFRSFMDDTPPMPLAPLRTPNQSSFSRDSNLSAGSRISKEEASGFDFGIPEAQSPITGLDDLPEEPPSSKFQDNTKYVAFNPANLHPAAATTELGNDAPRKSSNASTTSAFSVTSFARALGLEEQMNHSESSGSDSSPSDARSGSSMSSVPSDVSLNRHKPSDPLNLSPLVEELPARTRETVLEIPGSIPSTMGDVPLIPAAFFSPDSPTDPSINRDGLSLIAERKHVPPTSLPAQPKQSIPRKPPAQRSFTAPVPQAQPQTPPTPTRSVTRSKGKCKGCNEIITGKSISSSDGRLTGRYHRGCFVCFECHSPFQTVDFYVLNNRPFCAQHYHERNGSLCAGCHTGIEGHYLETVERNPARSDRRRFHTQCLQCRTCHILLKGDYFEWNGEVFCERDARRAAAASHPPPPGPPGPPGRLRPTLPPSPLAQYPPGPYHTPGGRHGPGYGPGPGPGLHPGAPFPPGGGGRFPERRTTKLMMT